MGFAAAILASILFGVGGTFAQFLFQHRGVNIDWLVTMRSTHGNLRRTSMTGFFMRNGPMPAAVLPARELLRNFAEEKVH